MIGPGSDLRVLICTKPVDLGSGSTAWSPLIQNQLGFDPYAGGIAYVFRAKRKTDADSTLGSDRTCPCHKAARRHGWLLLAAGPCGTYRLTAAEFSVLFSGADWRRVRSKRRPLAPKVDLREHSLRIIFFLGAADA
ncbi:IS66 family insertion sequence element accessory protein TnpB [Sphingobium cloacae]|nr:IS66 family insertion sequence element accessory protein TnpB [Sphingobium cloacae]